MDYSWPLFFMLAVAVFSAFKIQTDTVCSNLFVTMGLCVLSATIADMLVKLLVNILPRKLLPDLHNKAVFVTGCDTGFGNLCARRLDSLGVTVFAGCLFPEGPEAIELKATTSSNLHVVGLDVTNQKQVDDAVKYVEKSLDGKEMWAVINNAGIGTLGDVDWNPIDLLQQVMDVNTYGVVRMTKAFLPMIKKYKGRVVCLISIAARCTFSGLTYYSMSKAAVRAFVDGLRKEMKKWSVSVHGIEPTAYSTGIISAQNVETLLKKSLKNCPEETRATYGTEYLEDYQRWFTKLPQMFSCTNLQQVVDDMVDAAVGLTPTIRYVPGLFGKCSARLLAMIPTEIEDLVNYVLFLPIRKPSSLTAGK